MKLKYWIKERHNPQLGVYYVASGQMTAKEARSHERALYGHNFMRPYATEQEYKAEIDRLRERGERVQ